MQTEDIFAPYEEGVNKWYLVGIREKPEIIVNTTKVLNTGSSEYGDIWSLTPPYKTKEILIDKNKVLPKPCVLCGGVCSTNYTDNRKMIERNMCFSCNLWTDRIKSSKAANVMIVDHTLYSIHGEEGTFAFRGFGGHKFTFRLLDSKEERVSTNVWSGGPIPERFWDEIPDNAEIINNNGNN